MISFPELRYLLHTNGFKITEVTTNRIKPVSLVYFIFTPLVFLATLWVYIKNGKKQSTININKSILKTMFLTSVLWGETLIVKAKKTTSNNFKSKDSATALS